MMKKLLYGLTMVAAMASCTDDYTDWAQPLSNAEEAAKTVEMTVGAVGDINLANTAETVQLFVPTLKVSDNAVSTYTVDLYKKPYVAHESEHATLTTDAEGRVAAADLQHAVVSLFGARPEKRDIGLLVTCLTQVGTQVIKNEGSTSVNVTPKAPFIDTAYYLVGDFAAWNKEGALAFTHLGSGDVYDSPEFQIVFTTTAENQYWKIISGTNYENDFWAEGETGVVGTLIDGDSSMEGDLTTNSPQAGKIEQPGIYRMTINMMNYTYKLEKMEFTEFVYFIGATDGWSQSVQRLYSPNFDGVYTGYLYCADPNGWGNKFKFQKEAGNWDTQLNADSMTGGISGDFADSGDGDRNFEAKAGEGVYYVTLDLSAGTLHSVRIYNMNLVGDFNGWNPGDDAQQMTWDPVDYCFVITGAGVNSNGWKFTANNSWDINLGGNDTVQPSMKIDDLVGGGKDLGAVGNTIKLYPTRKTSGKIYCTVE